MHSVLGVGQVTWKGLSADERMKPKHINNKMKIKHKKLFEFVKVINAVRKTGKTHVVHAETWNESAICKVSSELSDLVIHRDEIEINCNMVEQQDWAVDWSGTTYEVWDPEKFLHDIRTDPPDEYNIVRNADGTTAAVGKRICHVYIVECK